MSKDDYRGSYWVFSQLMQSVQNEITRGDRKGVTVLAKKANPKKVTIGWFQRRVLRGEFRKKA